jgi:hypothetical protein
VRSSLSEIIKGVLSEMVGVALAALCHLDDALGDLVARPGGRKL